MIGHDNGWRLWGQSAAAETDGLYDMLTTLYVWVLSLALYASFGLVFACLHAVFSVEDMVGHYCINLVSYLCRAWGWNTLPSTLPGIGPM